MLSNRLSLCCSSFSFIIHVHYQHLLTLIHVDDCFTTSLTLIFSLPSPCPFHPPRIVYPSVHTLSRFQYVVVKTIAPTPYSPPLSPRSSSFFPLPALHLISIVSLFFVVLFSPSRNCTVLYLFHARWYARLLSTIYLIVDGVTRGKLTIYGSCAMFQPQLRRLRSPP